MTTATAPPAAPPRAAYRIVKATPEHLGALMALYEAYETERGHALSRDDAQRFGDEAFAALYDLTQRIAVAEVGKRAVGFVAARLVEAPLALIRQSLHVRVLYVRPEYRRSTRIGYGLWTVVCELSKTAGVPITAQVPYDKAEVRRWQRRGGRPVAVVMVRPLKEAPRG